MELHDPRSSDWLWIKAWRDPGALGWLHSSSRGALLGVCRLAGRARSNPIPTRARFDSDNRAISRLRTKAAICSQRPTRHRTVVQGTDYPSLGDKECSMPRPILCLNQLTTDRLIDGITCRTVIAFTASDA